MEDGEVRIHRVDWPVFEGVVRRRMQRMMLAMLGFAALFMAGLTLLMRPANPDYSVLLAVLVVAVMGVLVTRTQRTTIAKQKELWSSFELAMSANVLRRQALGLVPLEVVRTEVASVVEKPTFGLFVETKSGQALFIPEQLHGYGEVREHLSRWREFQRPSASSAVSAIAYAVLILGSWVGVGLLRGLHLALLCTLLLVASCARVYSLTTRESNATAQTKRQLLRGFGFMLLAPVARLVLEVVLDQPVGIWP